MVSSTHKKMRIAYFGSYDSDYTRTRTTLKGFARAGCRVVEINGFHIKSRLLRLINISYRYLLVARDMDVMLVSEAGQAYVFIAKILCWLTKKPLVFDAFVSYYQVKVTEGGEASPRSLKGKYFYYLDKLSCILADGVIVDTKEHAEYFIKTFNLPKEKMYFIPVGSDDEIFFPQEKKSDAHKIFTVYLITSFYPLHGVHYVVEAARYLRDCKDIRFIIAGEGAAREKMETLIRDSNLTNIIVRRGYITSKQLAEQIAEADICLGQFGKTEQSEMVVPAKVYDALAMRKPMITGNTFAVRNMFKHKEQVFLCPLADGKAIADAIIALKKDVDLRKKIAEGGYKMFLEKFSNAITGRQFKELLIRFVAKKHILFLSSDLSQFGGIQTYSKYIIQTLAEVGYSVSVLELKKSTLFHKTVFVFNLCTIAVLRNVDLIFCSHINFTPICFLLQRFGLPRYTITTHGIEVWNLRDAPRKMNAIAHAPFVLAVSHFTRETLIKQIPSLKNKIFILPSVVDKMKFSIKEKPVRLIQKYGFTTDDRIILTIARLAESERYKGYDKVLGAMKTIVDIIGHVRYILVGDGSDRIRVEGLIEDYGLDKKVIITGFVPDNELVDYYNLCDVFVMPSTSEGFGTVFLEALACGKPVIAGNRDGSRDPLLDGELGLLINPDDIQEVTNAIVAVLKGNIQPQLFDSNYLRDTVLAHYGIESFRKILKHIMEENI